MNTRTVIFKTKRDGLTIRGYIYGMEENRKKPCVIISHGFLADSRSVRIYAKLLAKLGYVAFTFDFCGGGIKGRSDGKTEDMTIFTEQRDLMAVIDYARRCPFVDSEHISLMGCSQGGYVSAITAAQFPWLVDKLIMFYPALCIPDDARQGRMMFYFFDPNNIPDILGKAPIKLGGEYARSVIDKNPFEQISGFEGPVLLVHGTGDMIVNIAYSEHAYGCYPDIRYERIYGAGHGFSGKHNIQAMTVLSEFMKLK
ncbi:MAG: alpha/beta hydrolase [Clostridia bacterium]|nr:alpha/beta hydrolase [Clostridia bacterium]